MVTIAQALDALDAQRAALATNLTTMGVTAAASESFAELVPKVLLIDGGGGSPPSAYATAVLDDTPLRYHRLEESGGTVAVDSSPYAVDGAFVGSPTFEAVGAHDLAVTVAAGSAVTADLSGATLGTAGTVELWWKYTTAASIFFRDNTSASGTGCFLADTYLRWGGTNYSHSGLSGINDGLWHHLVVTVDGSTITLYVDGVSFASWSSSKAFSSIVSPVWFGRNGTNSTQWMPGGFDEVAIYDYALTSVQVADHYSGGS